MGKNKTFTTAPKATVGEEQFNKFVNELYDYGLTGEEVNQELTDKRDKGRTNPKGKDFENRYVWNTADRLDRALSLAQSRASIIEDYEKRLQALSVLINTAKDMIWSSDTTITKTILEATQAFMKTDVSPWAKDSHVMTDRILCAICLCDLCKARIQDPKQDCCDHKDDNGSWGLPF
jgi:hypothetical protein